jgi:hypothetical protein
MYLAILGEAVLGIIFALTYQGCNPADIVPFTTSFAFRVFISFLAIFMLDALGNMFWEHGPRFYVISKKIRTLWFIAHAL